MAVFFSVSLFYPFKLPPFVKKKITIYINAFVISLWIIYFKGICIMVKNCPITATESTQVQTLHTCWSWHCATVHHPGGQCCCRSGVQSQSQGCRWAPTARPADPGWGSHLAGAPASPLQTCPSPQCPAPLQPTPAVRLGPRSGIEATGAACPQRLCGREGLYWPSGPSLLFSSPNPNYLNSLFFSI